MVAEAAALGLFMVAPGMDLPPKTPAPAKNSDALPPPGNPGDDILGFGEENKEQTKKKKITVKRLRWNRRQSGYCWPSESGLEPELGEAPFGWARAP